MDDLIAKPIAPDELLSKIAQWSAAEAADDGSKAGLAAKALDAGRSRRRPSAMARPNDGCYEHSQGEEPSGSAG